MTEHLDHVADCLEIAQTVGEGRVVEIAVGQVGEGNLKAAQHLARCEQTALAVAQAHPVGVRAFIARPPEQHGYVQRLGKPCADILRSEVAVGQEESVHPCFRKLFNDCGQIMVVIKQPFCVDVVDIHEFHV